MSRYVFTRLAKKDLREILEYVGRRSPQSAERLYDRFHEVIRSIAANPDIGHRRPDVTDAPLRFLAVHSWLIVYRFGKKPVTIVRIVHGARDLRPLFEVDEA